MILSSKINLEIQKKMQLTAQKLLDKKNEYILITSAIHMKRSILCFENEGLKIIPFSVDNSMSYSSNKIEYILLPRAREFLKTGKI